MPHLLSPATGKPSLHVPQSSRRLDLRTSRAWDSAQPDSRRDGEGAEPERTCGDRDSTTRTLSMETTGLSRGPECCPQGHPELPLGTSCLEEAALATGSSWVSCSFLVSGSFSWALIPFATAPASAGLSQRALG